MHTDWITQVLSKDNPEQTWKEKFKYCANKNQLVITVGRNLLSNVTFLDSQPHAYPPIISNLHGMSKDMQDAMCFILAYGHEMQNDLAFNDAIAIDIKNAVTGLVAGLVDGQKEAWNRIIDNQTLLTRAFPCAGVSLATIYANAISGDNVGSVMIGGLITVQNGPAYVSRCFLSLPSKIEWYLHRDLNSGPPS